MSGFTSWLTTSVGSLDPVAKSHFYLTLPGTQKLLNVVLQSCASLNTLRMSCFHRCKDSCENQVDHPNKADYPWHVVAFVTGQLLKEDKHPFCDVRNEVGKRSRNLAVIPYSHHVSHHLKQIGVNTQCDCGFFSAPEIAQPVQASFSQLQ